MISTTGLLLALGAAVLFTAFGLLSRVLAVQSKSPLAFSVAFGLAASLLCLPVFFIEPFEFSPVTLGVLVLTILATLLFGLYDTGQFFARKELEASRLTTLFQITPVVTFIGSLIFLSESFSIEKAGAIALIFGGNLVAVYRHGGNITRRGLLFALMTVVSLGFAYVVDKAVFRNYPLGLYMFIVFFGPVIWVYLLHQLRGGTIREIIEEAKRGSWKIVVLAFTSVAGYYLVLRTFQITEASVAIPTIFTSTILTALGGIIILKERGNIPQKILGAALVFAGIVLLN